MAPLPIDLRAGGLPRRLPVKAGRASARERLRSYREPASRNPQTESTPTNDRLHVPAHRFAFYPPVLHVRWGFRASSRLASRRPPRSLATPRRAIRAMRSTDLCHLNERRAPVPRAFPVRCRGFRRVDTPRSLGLRAAYQGTECFTTLANASADRTCARTALPRIPSPRGRENSERGRFLPTVSLPTEPLTPLSRLPVPRKCRSAFALVLPCSCERWLSHVRKSPRSP